MPSLPTSIVTDPIRRTFRTILSGDPAGEPPWVKAIGQPGDAGWFGPGSAAWLVNGSLATLVGGPRALLMQACHPLALAGVEQHSTYRDDPLGRLQRTNLYVTTSTFGTTELAQQAAEMVARVHRRVAGVAPDGREYSAQDPRLLLWVHLGLTDSMLRAYQRYGGTPVDADAYVRDMAQLARALGVPTPPVTERELTDSIASFSAELAGGADAQAVAQFLRFPGRALPVGAWGPYEVLIRAATDLLPSWAHEHLGSKPRPRAVRVADGVACSALLRSLQTVLGPRSRAVELAHERVAAAERSASGVDDD
ncbi:MAG TPA: oxygenase MpaB family protein [Actinomycetes bacterium]|nr:oxygenase MpaB family protein [Actinomycetes bacterium]